jgi:PAS domain-containing protein
MANVVPEKGGLQGPDGGADFLGQVLEALLEFTGAAAGWVGLVGADGRLTFPARRGDFADSWLTTQQGQDNPVWGFEVRELCTLTNLAVPKLGEPVVGNLLSCPLLLGGVPRGQVVLVNKPGGFAPADTPVLQVMTHLMSRALARRPGPPPPDPLPRFLRLALDRSADGAFVVDARGLLVYANPVWVRWTGFGLEELLARPAPFPFWVSLRQIVACGLRLAAFSSKPQAASRNYLRVLSPLIARTAPTSGASWRPAPASTAASP